MRICSKCGSKYPLSGFSKKAAARDGYDSICKECYKKYWKRYLRRVGRETVRRIHLESKRSFRGHALVLFNGILKRTRHDPSYKGLKVSFKKEAFLNWVMATQAYKTLYRQWVEAGYSVKLSPSINRLDSSKGYSFSNIEVITVSDNSKLAHEQRRGKKLFCASCQEEKEIEAFDLNMKTKTHFSRCRDCRG